jgi:predicted NAD-dependent protein-ADP-ribosyltransferase YbiA (DUF1768 family)
MKKLILLLLCTTACQSSLGLRDFAYPPEWWTPVPREGAPAWEILPQDARPGEVILSKRTELGILSNFAATPFVYRGRRYASVEGFWQMLKYPEGPNDERLKDPRVKWALTRDQVSQLTAFEAKQAGNLANSNMKILGITWVSFEGHRINYLENKRGEFYQLIVNAEASKLMQNIEVKNVLRKTGRLMLRPDHLQDTNSAPAWHYHEIWMELRSAL